MNSPPDDPHYHCEPGYDCYGCGMYVCPRCDGPLYSTELGPCCYWIEDPGTPGLDGAA